MQLETITRRPDGVARPTPLLFVHGAWHGAWCWDVHFLPYFAERGYRAHALSLRGHGGSPNDKPLRLTSIADYVADVARLVEQLDSPPVLIGHSMGGLVVQKYLEDHQVPAAVLLAAVPVGGVLPITLRIATKHPLIFLRANLSLSLRPLVETPALVRGMFFGAEMPEQEVVEYAARLGDESYLAFLGMLVLSLPRPRKVKTPLLVLGATHDTVFRPPQVERTARAYGAQAEFFPMAHDMMLEAGWQAVADRIVTWLDQHGL